MGWRFFFVLVVLIYGTSFVRAGDWGEWLPISTCTAKPCNCTGDVLEKSDCKEGKRTDIRRCIISEDGWGCKYGGKGKNSKDKGMIQVKDCYNLNVCPGWSDWVAESNCICTDDIYNEAERNDSDAASNGLQKLIRYCNNPPPIHKSVKCLHDGEPMEKATVYVPCNCTGDEVTPGRPATTTEIVKKCCPHTAPPPDSTTQSIDYPDYGNSTSNTTFGGFNASGGSLEGGALEGGSQEADSDDGSEDGEDGEEQDDDYWNKMYDDLDQEEEADCVWCPIVTDVTQEPEGTTESVIDDDLS